MKGIVFNLFCELVEEKLGLKGLDEMLTNVKVTDNGAYTAGGTYPDDELYKLIGYLSEKTKIEVKVLLDMFGQFMFSHLIAAYPSFVKPGMQLKEFLKSIDNVIHVEVNKLYPNAKTPHISYEEPTEKELIMLYRSPRKLCALSEGLIKGAAKHFQTTISLAHPICMHEGADFCKIEVKFA